MKRGDRVLIMVRGYECLWSPRGEARVLAVTEDGRAAKVQRRWYQAAEWLPVHGPWTRLRTIAR